MHTVEVSDFPAAKREINPTDHNDTQKWRNHLDRNHRRAGTAEGYAMYLSIWLQPHLLASVVELEVALWRYLWVEEEKQRPTHRRISQ